MLKKIALIVLFIGVAAGMAFLLFKFFFAGAPSTAPVTGTGGGATVGGGGLPTAGPGGGGTTVTGGQTGTPGLTPSGNIPVVASGGPTAAPAVDAASVLSPSASGDALGYYNRDDGHFYRVLPDGSKISLSEKAFPSASDVKWSPQGDKALIEFPDQSKVIYDFTAQRQVSIPRHWEDVQFTGDGSTVIAKSMSLDPDSRWLVASAADGSGTKLIEPLGENGDKVTVSVSPDNAIVAFSDTADPVGFDSRDLLLIGQNGENLPALRVEGFGFIPEWSPDGDHLLYSAAAQRDSYLPTLWFVGANGNIVGSGRTNLGIHTWADKCTFSDADTVFCAVPDGLPEGAGLQRDIAIGVPDNLVRIDLKNGTSNIIGRPAEDTSISNLTVAEDGSRLFFTDDQGVLREMRLR